MRDGMKREQTCEQACACVCACACACVRARARARACGPARCPAGAPPRMGANSAAMRAASPKSKTRGRIPGVGRINGRLTPHPARYARATSPRTAISGGEHPGEQRGGDGCCGWCNFGKNTCSHDTVIMYSSYNSITQTLHYEFTTGTFPTMERDHVHTASWRMP